MRSDRLHLHHRGGSNDRHDLGEGSAFADNLVGDLGNDEIGGGLFGADWINYLSGRGNGDSCDGGPVLDAADALCETIVGIPRRPSARARFTREGGPSLGIGRLGTV